MKGRLIGIWLILMLAGFGAGQSPTGASGKCLLAGAYRIDVEASDKLYSVVRGATSSVPFQDQQRFFLDLSTRFTPPDMLALECRGREVSVASSRAAKATFLADGINRRQRTGSGSIIQSRVTLTRNKLTFASNGKAEDRVNVIFESIDDGRRMRVTRRIFAEQLTQPIVIQSFYDKISDVVPWEGFGESRVAAQVGRRTDNEDDRSRTNGESGEATVLRRSLNYWIDATNRLDIERQMSFYMPQLKAFYLTRNTPKSRVREEKNRSFSSARSIDIRAEDPEIVFLDNGNTAVMRFRKQYRIIHTNRALSGEVVQELRWQRTSQGWRIFSERDIRVIR